MNYQSIEIISITSETINTNFSHLDFYAQRLDKNLKIIKKLKCIYILNYDKCFIKASISQ